MPLHLEQHVFVLHNFIELRVNREILKSDEVASELVTRSLFMMPRCPSETTRYNLLKAF